MTNRREYLGEKIQFNMLLPHLGICWNMRTQSSFYLGQDDQIKNIKILNGATTKLACPLEYFMREEVIYRSNTSSGDSYTCRGPV